MPSSGCPGRNPLPLSIAGVLAGAVADDCAAATNQISMAMGWRPRGDVSGDSLSRLKQKILEKLVRSPWRRCANAGRRGLIQEDAAERRNARRSALE